MMAEAQMFWDSIVGKIKSLIKLETTNALRAERYEVTTAPNGTVIGVTKALGSTELFLPYSQEVASAIVGQPVLVVWWGSMSNAKVYYYATGYNGSSGGGGGGGGIFIPSVSSVGIISWTNNAGLPNPPPVDIMGPEGASGVYVGTTTPTDPDVNVWVDPSADAHDGCLTYTSDGWTVRKWDSGVAECWREVTTETFACTSAIGSIYQSAAGQHQITYPTGLFTSVSNVQISATANNSRFINIWDYETNSTPRTDWVDLVMMTAASTSILPTVHIYTIGRWK